MASRTPRPRAAIQPRTAVVVDENYKPTEVVEPLWHPSGCDSALGPRVVSGRAVVIGWLPRRRRHLDLDKAALRGPRRRRERSGGVRGPQVSRESVPFG